jgi:hypothetical protein
MEKIEAWKTIDGKVFEHKDDAIKHEKEEQININRERDFLLNKEVITNHIKNHFEAGDFRIGKIPEKIDFYYEGEYGWDCDNKKENPIDKCIYSFDLYMGDDCCVFCGQPEERK